MQAPKFWEEESIQSLVLMPVSYLYEFLYKLRNKLTKTIKLKIPIICIGNITVGGAGKTPTAIAVAEYLISKGLTPHFLSRGYGRKLKGTLKVNDEHTALMVGDEPILLSKVAPTWVCSNKLDGAEEAQKNGAEVIIMDDGFQNPSIHKDLSILVIDEGFGIGNGKIIPAGPLRERAPEAFNKADGVIIIKTADGKKKDFKKYFDKPTIHANLVPAEDSSMFSGSKVVAFCGIGRPKKFYSTVESIGAKIITKHDFSDHHTFTPDELMKIIEESSSLDAIPITTEKDWIRLPQEAKKMISYIKVNLIFSNPNVIYKVLNSIF